MFFSSKARASFLVSVFISDVAVAPPPYSCAAASRVDAYADGSTSASLRLVLLLLLLLLLLPVGPDGATLRGAFTVLITPTSSSSEDSSPPFFRATLSASTTPLLLRFLNDMTVTWDARKKSGWWVPKVSRNGIGNQISL
jgi:hypothetical protein